MSFCRNFLFFTAGLIGTAHIEAAVKLSEGTGKRVDIVSYWDYYPPELDNPLHYRKLKENFDVTFYVNLYDYVRSFRGDDPSLHKIVFIDICKDTKTSDLPKSKLISFIFEPHVENFRGSKVSEYYDRIFTFMDDLVDNNKFFKFHYPVLLPQLENTPSFYEKNLCVMINSRWNSERNQILDFFATKPKDLFHVYGTRFRKFKSKLSDYEMIKGKVPGVVSCSEKLNVLKKYRFCICFENTHNQPGYVTEKIFDVFAAGCVPIYWGPDNIEQYIPSNCFIDYRKFKSDEEMFQRIVSMQEAEYNQYLTNIKAFLASDEARQFSIETFEELLYEAVTH